MKIAAIVFTVLVILGARTHPLWGDESEVALFARNINRQCCVLRGWDGVNLLAHHDSVNLNSDLVNHSNPPLQYYLTALSFRLFGESAMSARLPFAIISIFTIPLAYALIFALTKNKRLSLLAVLALSLSAPFILYAYQARYYALTVFFGMGFFYSAYAISGKKTVLTAVALIVSGILYIYSHYISFVGFYIAVFAAICVDLAGQKNPSKLRRFIIAYMTSGFIIGMLFLPWFLYFQPFAHRAQLAVPTLTDFVAGLPAQVVEGAAYFNHNNAFPVALLPFLVLVLVRNQPRDSGKRVLWMFTTIAVTYLVLMGALTLVTRADTPFTAVRFNVVLFPFLVSASIMSIAGVLGRHRILFTIALAGYVFTNILSFQGAPRIFLWEYLGEIAHPYTTANELVVSYLNTHAQDGDTAFVNLDREHEPLLFYLKKKVLFINRVTPNNPKLFPQNLTRLPSYLYKFRGEPDWVILYSKRGNDGSFYTYDNRMMPAGVDLTSGYTETVLPVFFSDLTRPEIEIHAFEEVRPEWRDQVFVYRKK